MCSIPYPLILLLLTTVSCQNTVDCPAECNCTTAVHLTCRDLTSFPKSFASKAEIVSIYLSNLPIIPFHAFSQLPNMKILDMYSVTIGTIESCAFENLHNMSRISIYNAKIGTIKKGAFRDLTYDGYFSLYMSQVESIESYAFSDVANTKSFTIFNSNVTLIESRAFHRFHDLTKFSIYSSNITHIKSGAFEDFQRIETITLHENYLQRIECNTVDTLQRELDTAFSFDRILVNCDCHIKWLISLEGSARKLLKTTFCKEPLTLDGRVLTYLTVPQICSEVTDAGLTCLPLPVEDQPNCKVNTVNTVTETEPLVHHVGDGHGHEHGDGHEHMHGNGLALSAAGSLILVIFIMCVMQIYV